MTFVLHADRLWAQYDIGPWTARYGSMSARARKLSLRTQAWVHEVGIPMFGEALFECRIPLHKVQPGDEQAQIQQQHWGSWAPPGGRRAGWARPIAGRRRGLCCADRMPTRRR
eukprot:3576507-Amphidinium_carterae.4